HGLLVASPRRAEQPTNGERLAAVSANFDRHLVRRATNAPGAHLNGRHDVVQRLAKHAKRVLLGLALDQLEGAVDDRLGDRLLALVHDRVHELGHDLVVVLRVGSDLALIGAVTAGHVDWSVFSERKTTEVTSVAWLRISNAAACGL